MCNKYNPQTLYNGYTPSPRLRLIASITIPDQPSAIRAEIEEANHTTRTFKCTIPGHPHKYILPYTAINGVWMEQDGRVIENFGRPPLADAPAWIQYAEAV